MRKIKCFTVDTEQ